MELKQEVVYRKAKKADFPTIVELIRQENQSRWECEDESTEKRLGKLLFYQYRMAGDTVIAATYRERVVVVIIAGKGFYVCADQKAYLLFLEKMALQERQVREK